MYLLGNVYRQQGRPSEAVQLFTQLYEVVLSTQGQQSDNAVGLAKTLCDLYDEVGGQQKAIRPLLARALDSASLEP